MKITKFAQSCVLIETNGKRILVDPGYLRFENSLLDLWRDSDIILVTHKHQDHCYVDVIKKIMKSSKVKLYTTKEVADACPELKIEVVKQGDVINLEDIKIEVVKAIHGYNPLLKGKEIFENVGYIIDADKKVYLTGDTICFKNDYKCDVIFVPVCNHGIVMGSFEAGLFSKETGASLVIPYHYDNPTYPVDLNLLKNEFEKQDINFKILDIWSTIEV